MTTNTHFSYIDTPFLKDAHVEISEAEFMHDEDTNPQYYLNIYKEKDIYRNNKLIECARLQGSIELASVEKVEQCRARRLAFYSYFSSFFHPDSQVSSLEIVTPDNNREIYLVKTKSLDQFVNSHKRHTIDQRSLLGGRTVTLLSEKLEEPESIFSSMARKANSLFTRFFAASRKTDNASSGGAIVSAPETASSSRMQDSPLSAAPTVTVNDSSEKAIVPALETASSSRMQDSRRPPDASFVTTNDSLEEVIVTDSEINSLVGKQDLFLSLDDSFKTADTSSGRTTPINYYDTDNGSSGGTTTPTNSETSSLKEEKASSSVTDRATKQEPKVTHRRVTQGVTWGSNSLMDTYGLVRSEAKLI